MSSIHPNRKAIDHLAAIRELDLLLMDNFDEAILGIVELTRDESIVSVVAYSLQKILDKLVKGGCTLDEAYEYYEFNIEGAYTGPHTPIYIDDVYLHA